MPTKICIRKGCDEPQPEENFYKQNNGRRIGVCMGCKKKDQSEYHAKRQRTRAVQTPKQKVRAEETLRQENLPLISYFLSSKSAQYFIDNFKQSESIGGLSNEQPTTIRHIKLVIG